MAAIDESRREPIPAWYSVARQRNARRRRLQSDAEYIRTWWGESRVGRGRIAAETIAIPSGAAYWADGPDEPIRLARFVRCGRYVCRCGRDQDVDGEARVTR